MKLTDVTEIYTVKGSWTIHNMVGQPKKFMDPEGTEAKKWMMSREIPLDRDEIRRGAELRRAGELADRNDRQRERHLARQAKIKPSLDVIWNYAQEAIGNSFPDGDPMDSLGTWARQNNVDMDDINRAARKATGQRSKTFYEYLASMWDDHAADHLHDAQAGAHGEDYSNEWFARPNPWR